MVVNSDVDLNFLFLFLQLDFEPKQQDMKGKRRPRIGSHERDDEGEELDPEHLEVEHVIGDVLWVRRDDDGTWWPAVVCHICQLYIAFTMKASLHCISLNS